MSICIYVEVDVDIDSYFGSLQRVSKSVRVPLDGIAVQDLHKECLGFVHPNRDTYQTIGSLDHGSLIQAP